MRRIQFNIWIVSLMMFCFFTSCDTTNDVRTIKLAHSLDVGHSVHKAMVKMGEDLEQISGGKMTLEIYPSQQLGTERECIELLQIGSLDMTKVSVGVMENFAPRMKVFGLPYLFKDRQQSFNVLDGPIGQELLDEGTQYWIKGLGYYDAGSRSFYTKDKPINSPADLKGLKIRVMESVTAMDMVKSLGGSATPISWGELYTSLQQGVVDGAENNPPSFYLSRHYEVCKYYSLDEHTMLPDVLIIGTHIWEKLSEQEKKWLKEAVDKSVVYQRKLWAESEKEALDAVQEAGVKIIYPDKSLFEKDVESVYSQYKDDKDMSSLIERIKNTN
ncbi:TRAP transporter substrate-binding protein [Subsaxibacter sp. CAU 1640]|uniref:TRAP transporter substrate-binding protein n=1 Tax=Subsaxibacter sp. CAU 1640 TaxID=2933271 RepID=UPI00200484DE|nr:TRAP transporter substrate-binding protein [Subsaxibacter sp. CAU 1640]MCK7589090.1 TRAP transporter substrate-binding protein [Subsaxibacter sp. CAU 1640]